MNRLSSVQKTLIRKVSAMKAEAKKTMREKSGQQSADNMGWIAVIVVVILVILVYSVPAIKDGFLPDLQNEFKKIFTFHS